MDITNELDLLNKSYNETVRKALTYSTDSEGFTKTMATANQIMDRIIKAQELEFNKNLEVLKIDTQTEMEEKKLKEDKKKSIWSNVLIALTGIGVPIGLRIFDRSILREHRDAMNAFESGNTYTTQGGRALGNVFNSLLGKR